MLGSVLIFRYILFQVNNAPAKISVKSSKTMELLLSGSAVFMFFHFIDVASAYKLHTPLSCVTFSLFSNSVFRFTQKQAP